MKQHPLLEQFKNHCRVYFPNMRNQNLLLAVSGGRDSMALAVLLLESGFKFGIAHCNYQLRGDASNEDAALVRAFADEWQLHFHYIEFNPEHLKSALQERARALRYEWFEELCDTFGYASIVTAHHANDNAETLLMNLAKGTGIRGLHGIPVHNGRIIRPLLFADRTEISAYVREKEIPFREDQSNDTDDYSRNCIRHHVIPALMEIFPQTVKAMATSAGRISGAEKYYLLAIEKERKKLLERRGADHYIPVKRLLQTADTPTMLYELLLPFGFSAPQTQEALKLIESGSGHFIESETHRLIKDRDFLIIGKRESVQSDFLLIPGSDASLETPEGVFRFREVSPASVQPEQPNCIYVAAEQLQFPLTLRRRRTGDYFYPSGFGMKKKKVSKLLIDKKVNLVNKDRVWILANGLQIVWVAGFRADERFLPRDSSKKILRIEFIPAG